MSMWEPFTEDARQGIVLAQAAALRFGQNYIGDEHILMGITTAPSSEASKILVALNVEIAALHRMIESRLVASGGVPSEMVFTPRAKRVIELAFSEAHLFGHTYIGTEHLLLGVLGEGDGLGAQVLHELHLNSASAREKLGNAVRQKQPFVSFDHIQLAMPAGGENDARRFYADILEMTELPKPVELSARGGAWFASGAVQVHLGVDPDFRPAQKAHPALRCNNYEELTQKLREVGIAVRVEQRENGSEHAYVNDPFGNRIELLKSGLTVGRARAH